MEPDLSSISAFQRALYLHYKDCLRLPADYRYYYGNPIETIVPLDTCPRSVFIIGAYPSARFATINGIRDVPVGDNCGPFSSERYFDGSAIRCVKSGEELEKIYLSPLGLSRTHCWITDLVRVFLFKEGHITKYHKLYCPVPAHETRSKFEEYACAGISWLHREIELAEPKVIITLGAEVAGILRNIQNPKARTNLLSGNASEITINNRTYPVIHLAHPGIVMRAASETNPWPVIHETEHIPVARQEIERLLERKIA